jgi:hypothetical protein
METIKTVYEIKNPVFAFGRNLGMNIVNNIPCLKEKMMQGANQHPLIDHGKYEWTIN